MAAYMKTEMPFYGVQKPGRVAVIRQMKRAFVPESAGDYAAGVRALWALPHREERYLALSFASAHRRFVTVEQLDLYESLIREGAWWDLVDEIIMKLVNPITLEAKRRGDSSVRQTMDAWVGDPDLWIRRAAILCQAKHKLHTDADQLFGYCVARAPEREFFIRKAIGWALREYSKHEPSAVRDFLLGHRSQVSGLSRREGAKHLIRQGLMRSAELHPDRTSPTPHGGSSPGEASDLTLKSI